MLVLTCLCLGCTVLWLGLMRKRYRQTVPVPDCPALLYGVAYSPFRRRQSPARKTFPSPGQIREDLLLIAARTRRIRTYSIAGTLACIPRLAEESGLQVTLGLWIGQDLEANEREIIEGLKLARRFPCIEQIIVGSEALYRKDVTAAQLSDYLDQVRQQVSIPVSTSEQWHLWIELPELVSHVDFIAAHILPFWEGVQIPDAAKVLCRHQQQLQQAFPDTPLVITEVGWPSRGHGTWAGKLARKQQSIALRLQIDELEKNRTPYFLIEAFDQPWKTDEGIAGPHWGIYNDRRELKLQPTGAIDLACDWKVLLGRMLGIAPASRLGKLIICALGLALFGLLLEIGTLHLSALAPWLAWVSSGIWASVILLLLSFETVELIEAAWDRDAQRHFLPRPEQNQYRPCVSIHVPCCDEPPAMVIETLDSLARLDYPDFEVLVIDNNSTKADIGEPVKRHCARLGRRFRFFSVSVLPGYKAGALNYLLERTCAQAQIIAVIDADYRVQPNWLHELVPLFAQSDIAVIQAPQDQRDAWDNLFKYCCYAEYRAFFYIGMIIRNDHDAIIQHGTMTLVRRSALQTSRWSTWCICEDAELGLRLLEQGYSTGYVPVSYGKGLIPDDFQAYKKQRYRWAYGAIQIIKRHASELFCTSSSHLRPAQRYHFLAGWGPWLADGLNYLMLFISLGWSVAMLLAPAHIKPPPWLFSLSLLSMFTVRTLKNQYLYRRQVNADWRMAGAAMLADMALKITVGKAVVLGIATSHLPFVRTPKLRASHGLISVLRHVVAELVLLGLLWSLIISLCFSAGVYSADGLFWYLLLFIQSLPCLAALLMSLLACRHFPAPD